MIKNEHEFREYFNAEKIISLDLGYISSEIEKWWDRESLSEKDFFCKKSSLINLLINKIKDEDYLLFDDFGKINKFISGMVLHNVFTKDCPFLALLVHESLSDIFRIMDIKYPYEDHKALYLKKTTQEVSEWGNGAGNISLHSDDLYEDTSADYLSLTTCRDLSNTPTSYVLAKDILENLNDYELSILLNLEATFISGKNVDGLKSKTKKIIEFCKERGFLARFDFRIDKINGQRMILANKNPSNDEVAVFNKLFKISKNIQSRTVNNGLGTFLILDNYKVLHARNKIRNYPSDGYDHPREAFRLLYRSKGPRKQFFDIESLRYL